MLKKTTALTRLYLLSSSSKSLNIVYTLLFYLLQKVVPISNLGEFIYLNKQDKKYITFNSKNTQFESIYNPIFKNGYEPEVRVLLDMFLDNKGALYDVGSNWGYFSLYAASRVNFQGHIYAFEPFPSTFADLTSIVQQADLLNKITCLQLALGQKKGKVTIRYQGLLQSGLASLNPTNKSSLYPSSSVEITTLDEMTKEPPSMIKVDVEGLENDVFLGGNSVLKRYKPMIIFENSTWHKDISQTINPLTTLSNMGYQLFYPCWQQVNDKDVYLATEPVSQKFVLLPITPFNRFLFGRQINIFACHASRVDAITKHFSASSSPKQMDIDR